MSEREKPIWERYGIPIEEYAHAFNEELDKAWQRNLEHPERTMRICNINTDNLKR